MTSSEPDESNVHVAIENDTVSAEGWAVNESGWEHSTSGVSMSYEELSSTWLLCVTLLIAFSFMRDIGL